MTQLVMNFENNIKNIDYFDHIIKLRLKLIKHISKTLRTGKDVHGDNKI